jgi:stearoyl-CoA desaturase (delta-9 desaturase)
MANATQTAGPKGELTQEEFDRQVNLKALNVKKMSTKAVGRLEAVTKLDRPLAWVSTAFPAAAFVAAMVLLYYGYGGPLEIALMVVMGIATQAGIVVGFHRLCAHRSFDATPATRATLGILGSMAFQGPVIWWAATHRRHHKISDQEGDPHSPRLNGDDFMGLTKGLWHAHIGWLFSKESMRAPGWHRYAHDLYKDPVLLAVHMKYFYWLVLGFLIPFAIGGILTQTWTGALLCLLWGGPVRVFFTSHAIWGLNSFCHVFGMRPFEVAHEHSRNNVWLALPTLGEGWHNNHHAFPSSANAGLKWWQIDPAAYIIRSLELVGLAYNVKRPTKEMVAKKEARSAALRERMAAAQASQVETVA